MRQARVQRDEGGWARAVIRQMAEHSLWGDGGGGVAAAHVGGVVEGVAWVGDLDAEAEEGPAFGEANCVHCSGLVLGCGRTFADRPHDLWRTLRDRIISLLLVLLFLLRMVCVSSVFHHIVRLIHRAVAFPFVLL